MSLPDLIGFAVVEVVDGVLTLTRSVNLKLTVNGAGDTTLALPAGQGIDGLACDAVLTPISAGIAPVLVHTDDEHKQILTINPNGAAANCGYHLSLYRVAKQ